MSFSIGLSAMNAAQEEIAVTGNNIANASTNGFKSSRAEFADVYAATVGGGGSRQQGGGVGLQEIAQNFSQGNISFTDNTLDLAINGGGFFILRGEAGNVFTRAGAFGTDQNGNIVNSSGEKLQGFAATSQGKATGGGPLSDLVVTTGSIPPQATKLVASAINLDAAATPSSIIGSKVISNGGVSGVPQLGVRIAREAQIAGKISVTGTDFSGTTTARTVGSVNIQNGLNFNTAGGAQGFSISVNGGPYIAVDLSSLNTASAEEVRNHVQARLNAAPGLASPNNVVVTVENNRLIMTTAAEGNSARININAVRGLAASIVSASDVKGKTAPPTGLTIRLNGVSREIVIEDDFSNTGAAALALGGGAGSGNEALEDFIQSEINSSASLLGKIDVSIDNLGNFIFKTTSPGNHNLAIDPIMTTAGSVNFNQIVEFSTSRRTGSLDLDNLNFLGANGTSFTLSVGDETLQIVLEEDYRAAGGPAANLGEYAESGLEALEDEIQSQINRSSLPGAVKVSIAANGQFVFEITDSSEHVLKVESDSLPATSQGGLDVSNGYDFATTPYTFTVSYQIEGEPQVVSAPITLDTDYQTGTALVDALQNLINTGMGFTPGNIKVMAGMDPLTGELTIKTEGTGPESFLSVLISDPAVVPSPAVVGDTSALVDQRAVGSGPGLDFGAVATFSGNEYDNTGLVAVSNGYTKEIIDVVDSQGKKQQITVPAGVSANAVAALFSNVPGIAAKATTVAYITATNSGDPENRGSTDPFVDSNLPLRFAINGVNFESTQVQPSDRYTDLANQINGSSGNMTAKIVSNADGDPILEVTENNGLDLVFSGGTGGRGSITVTGSTRNLTTGAHEIAVDSASTQIDNLANLNNDAIVVGGVVDFTLDENVTMQDARKFPNGADIQVTQSSIFGNIDEADALQGARFELNTFDPEDANTYYRSTAIAVFDSLGNQHTLTQFFVKERSTASSPDGSLWSVYFQVDGKNIGFDPGSTDQKASMAKASLRFAANGLYDVTQEPIYITNWTPLDSSGQPAGAAPRPGDHTVVELLTNSNFKIDLTKLTQFGGDFAVQSNTQNGFAKGQLTGLEINTRGLVSARFSNGQSKVLGEVALADFADPTKLANIGGTRFAQTAESGEGTPSGAGTAGLGAIQSGALEESNVDLSEQLVQLIVSQRNFQAAAQIIESADSATQTIINL